MYPENSVPPSFYLSPSIGRNELSILFCQKYYSAVVVQGIIDSTFRSPQVGGKIDGGLNPNFGDPNVSSGHQ
jgi:hypothetical protein